MLKIKTEATPRIAIATRTSSRVNPSSLVLVLALVLVLEKSARWRIFEPPFVEQEHEYEHEHE
ncbi:MAG: hypothetical protein AAF492_00695 [Verrucomicrobiota bacterium]